MHLQNVRRILHARLLFSPCPSNIYPSIRLFPCPPVRGAVAIKMLDFLIKPLDCFITFYECHFLLTTTAHVTILQ